MDKKDLNSTFSCLYLEDVSRLIDKAPLITVFKSARKFANDGDMSVKKNEIFNALIFYTISLQLLEKIAHSVPKTYLEISQLCIKTAECYEKVNDYKIALTYYSRPIKPLKELNKNSVYKCDELNSILKSLYIKSAEANKKMSNCGAVEEYHCDAEVVASDVTNADPVNFCKEFAKNLYDLALLQICEQSNNFKSLFCEKSDGLYKIIDKLGEDEQN